jgi:hypothetical protein
MITTNTLPANSSKVRLITLWTSVRGRQSIWNSDPAIIAA